MKNSFWINSIALAAGLLVLFSSCVKERNMDEIYRPEGSEIIFGVENEYENSETGETRTIFTGTDLTVSGYTNKFERIDWVTGDKMTISYQRTNKTTQTGVYVVSSKTNSNEISNGSVYYYSGTKLTWNGGNNDHYFYAMYPENGNNRNTFTPVSGGATISGTIPASQSVTYNSSQGKYLPADMNLAFMVGYKRLSSGSTTSRVTIPFTPAVTMFEFNLKRASSGTTYVRSATLTATNATGTFSFKLTGGTSTKGEDWWNRTTSGTNPTTLTGNGNTITVNFSGFNSGKGVTMTNTNALIFTILARPIAYTNPVLTLVMSDDNGAHYFTKKVTLSTTFAACKKHIITNSKVPNATWEYTLEHTGTTITLNGNTYQQIVRSATSGGDTGTAPFNSYYKESGSGETQMDVGVTVQYAPDNNGVPGTFGNNPPSGSGLSSASVSGSINRTIKGTWAANSGTSISTLEGLHTARMKAKGSVGTSSAPQDLSLSNLTSSGVSFRSSSPTTANCYIIDRPGWYMFPLVYGNAISSGSVNSGAYTTSNSSSSIWQTLHKHDGTNINSAYIPTAVSQTSISSSALNALCLWQDAANTTADPTFISNVSVISKPSGATVNTLYIKFYVSPDTIHQGNAVIALRNGSTIIWSWHIWVTNGYQANGFPTIKIYAKNSGDFDDVKASNDFLKLALGECETGTVSGVSVSNERACWVKVTQNTSGKTLLFRVVQSGSSSGTPTITNYKSSCTYYQWGRKDPFPPSVPGSNSAKSVTGTGKTFEQWTSDNTAAKAIQNPTVFYMQTSDPVNWIGAAPMNLWNMNQTGQDQDLVTKKTVYDPCPPGYCAPNRYAFSNSTTNGLASGPINASGSWSNGWNFYVSGTSGTTFLEPAFGYLFKASAAITSVGSHFDFWTACGSYSNMGRQFYGASSFVYPAEPESRATGAPVRPAVE